MPGSCGLVRWLIFRRSSGCTNRFRFIPAASACLPETISRALPILAIPLVGIGLFYGQGYFRQRLDRHGWQQEEYLETDINQLPMELAIGKNGRPVVVQIETRSGSIHAKVWRVKVGRCDLFLLDSDVEGNTPDDRGADFAPLRRRCADSHPAGVVAGRRRFPRAQSDGHHAGRSSPERRAQRICGAGSDSHAHAGRGHRVRRRSAARVAGSGVHHAHSRACRSRSLRCGSDRRASWAAARSCWASHRKA